MQVMPTIRLRQGLPHGILMAPYYHGEVTY